MIARQTRDEVRISRAVGLAEEYRSLRVRGDLARAEQARRTVYDMASFFVDGNAWLPRVVADAMGRPELGRDQ